MYFQLSWTNAQYMHKDRTYRGALLSFLIMFEKKDGWRERGEREDEEENCRRLPVVPQLWHNLCILQTLSDGACGNHTPLLRIPHRIQSVSFHSWHP